MTAEYRPHRRLVAAALVLLALTAYEGVRHCSFLRYDDDLYVTGNPHLRAGFTPDALRWAFSADLVYDSPHADYWAPLTVLTRLADVGLFGFSPAGHHLTNLVFHAANVALLFAVLAALTGALWPSAFAAAVLAVHPLHVESVAWVTERKDVLSGFFWLLTIAAWIRHVRAPSRSSWALVLLSFACGLMSKPMVATLPLVLVLLDVWPLRRPLPVPRLLAEKWPLLLLSAASVAVSISSNAARLEDAPLRPRLVNALLSYVAYLGDAFWPVKLAVGYPQVGRAEASELVLWVLLLAGVSALVLVLRRSRPYLLVGWFWFVIVLLPVIGAVQVGVHGRADRFMYLPLVGLSLAVAFLVAEWTAGQKVRRVVAGALAVAAVSGLLLLTRRQVTYWTDDSSLFVHSASVLPESAIAQNGLATVLMQRGDIDGTEAALRRALHLRPDLVLVLRNLSLLLLDTGRAEEGASLIERAIAEKVVSGAFRRSELHLCLGLIRARQQRAEDAEAQYAEAVRLDPSQWAALYNWGNLLAAEGRFPEAEQKFVEARRINPDNENIVNNLGLTLLLQGRTEESLVVLEAAARAHPHSPLVRASLERARGAGAQKSP